MPEGRSLRSLMYSILACLFLLVVTVFLNRELLFAPGWMPGVVCGAGIAWAWTRSMAVRTAGALFGVATLGAFASGLFGAQEAQVRALAQGASIRFPVAFLLLAVIQWPRTHAYLLARAELFGDEEAVRWLERHRPKEER